MCLRRRRYLKMARGHVKAECRIKLLTLLFFFVFFVLLRYMEYPKSTLMAHGRATCIFFEGKKVSNSGINSLISSSLRRFTISFPSHSEWKTRRERIAQPLHPIKLLLVCSSYLIPFFHFSHIHSGLIVEFPARSMVPNSSSP
jgi:hypothetical protein